MPPLPTAVLSSDFAACKVGVRTHFLMNQLYGKFKSTAEPPPFPLPQEGPRNRTVLQLKVNQTCPAPNNARPQTRPQPTAAAAGAQTPTLPRLTAGLTGIRTQSMPVFKAPSARPLLQNNAGTTWVAQVNRIAAQARRPGLLEAVQKATQQTMVQPHDDVPPPLPARPSPPRTALYAQQHMFASAELPLPAASQTGWSVTVPDPTHVSSIPLPTPLPGDTPAPAADTGVTEALSSSSSPSPSPSPTKADASSGSGAGITRPAHSPTLAAQPSTGGSSPAPAGRDRTPPTVIAAHRKKEGTSLSRAASPSSGTTTRREKVQQAGLEASTAATILSRNTAPLPSWAQRAEAVQQQPGKPVLTPTFREAAAVRMGGTQTALMSLLEQRDAMIARAEARASRGTLTAPLPVPAQTASTPALRSKDQAARTAEVKRDALKLIEELKNKHLRDDPAFSPKPRVRMVDGLAVPILSPRKKTPERAYEMALRDAAEVAEQVKQDPPPRIFSTAGDVALKSALRSHSADAIRSPGKEKVRFSANLVMKGNGDQSEEVDSDYGSDPGNDAVPQSSPPSAASHQAADPYAPQPIHFVGPHVS